MYAGNPEGVVSVRFKTEEAAHACIGKMQGRFFGGRQLEANMWDGFTNFFVKARHNGNQKSPLVLSIALSSLPAWAGTGESLTSEGLRALCLFPLSRAQPQESQEAQEARLERFARELEQGAV